MSQGTTVQHGLWWAILAAGMAEACSPVDNHLLYGQQYVASGGCLEPAQAIDDIAGADPGTCAPSCLLATSDAGPIVFVTTTCGPYPSYLTSLAADAAASATDECKGALAAYAAAAVCGPDAGGTPDASADAGRDGEAAADAGPGGDAPAEAAVDAPSGG